MAQCALMVAGRPGGGSRGAGWDVRPVGGEEGTRNPSRGRASTTIIFIDRLRRRSASRVLPALQLFRACCARCALRAEPEFGGHRPPLGRNEGEPGSTRIRAGAAVGRIPAPAGDCVRCCRLQGGQPTAGAGSHGVARTIVWHPTLASNDAKGRGQSCLGSRRCSRESETAQDLYFQHQSCRPHQIIYLIFYIFSGSRAPAQAAVRP